MIEIILKGGTVVIVYLMDCQGASFLLLFKWLIKKRLGQFDGSLSDEHPWPYPSCQGGMNCPSHQRSPLVLLVEIMERHKLKTQVLGGGGKHQIMLHQRRKNKRWLLHPFFSQSHSMECSLFQVISHVELIWYGLNVFHNILTWYVCIWTRWKDACLTDSSYNQNLN